MLFTSVLNVAWVIKRQNTMHQSMPECQTYLSLGLLLWPGSNREPGEILLIMKLPASSHAFLHRRPFNLTGVNPALCPAPYFVLRKRKDDSSSLVVALSKQDHCFRLPWPQTNPGDAAARAFDGKVICVYANEVDVGRLGPRRARELPKLCRIWGVGDAGFPPSTIGVAIPLAWTLATHAKWFQGVQVFSPIYKLSGDEK